MKYLKHYEFNDGVDGIVIAKSVKHAVRKLYKHDALCGYTEYEVLESCKHDRGLFGYGDYDWEYDVKKVPKKKFNRKSKIVGRIE